MAFETGEAPHDGAGDNSPEAPEGVEGELTVELPPVAGRYLLDGFLGESRLGRTYRGHDPRTDQAVEVVFLEAGPSHDLPDAEARLERLRDLRHVHLLPLLDWQLDPVPYLVYRAAGTRLERFLEAGVALSPSQTLLIGLQAAETLHSLRRVGVVHGDLDPSHCSVDERGRLWLAGMGLEFLRRPSGPDGATRYRAPEAAGPAGPAGPSPRGDADDSSGVPEPQPPHPGEQSVGEWGPVRESGDTDAPVAEGVHAPAAADVYSLGVILTEVATGRPAVPGEMRQRLSQPAAAGAVPSRNLARLVPLLAQATAERPENRLESDELALALRATAEAFPPPNRLDEVLRLVEESESEAAAARPVPEQAPETSRRRRRRAPSLVAAAAMVVASVLLVILSAPDGGTPTHPVPGVVGTGWAQASETLAGSGWEVRRLEVRVSGVPEGEVVGQLPEPGYLLDEGQVVKVQVSLGEPLVVIPQGLVGLPLPEAGLRLSAIGLAVGEVRTATDPALPAGSVVAVDEVLPELPVGAAVDLVVAG